MTDLQPQSMTFAEYKILRAEGRVLAGISELDAQKVVNSLPRRYQYATFLWTWVWGLSIPGSICVSIFYRWWVGLLLLFFVTPMLFRAIKKSISQFVLEYAENDEQFFLSLVARNFLVFKQTGKAP